MSETRTDAQRAARTAQLREILNMITIGSGKDEMRLVVAEDAETVYRWGRQMSNAVGLYANQIEVETVFAVVNPSGTILVNGHIENDHFTMMYGRSNRPATMELDESFLDQLADMFTALGINTRKTYGVR